MSMEIHTLAGAYALDAVNDLERVEFGRHLAVCSSCVQEIAEFRETVARLTDVSAQVPPARLQASVMAEVARTRQISPGRREKDTPLDAVRRRGWRGWTAAAAAAAIIATGAGAIGYSISDQRVRGNQSAITAAQQETARISAVLSAPDARMHVERLAEGGTVTVIVAPSLNQGVATLSNMPVLSTNESYELWLIHGDKPVPAGVMAASVTTGTAFLTDVRGATAFGVSQEPAGGTNEPSTPLVTSFGLV